MAPLPTPNDTKCPFAPAAIPARTLDIPCAYASSASASVKDTAKLTTSATLDNYSAYLGSLHRNSYASYIRLMELEKTWGLWSLQAETSMPFDPLPHLLQASPTIVAGSAPPAPLYRLAPAMTSIEICLRLACDFMEVNLPALDDATQPRCRAHRPYVDHHVRMDSLLRNLTAQLQMLRTVIELDCDDTDDTFQAKYLLTPRPSIDSLGRANEWWWKMEHPRVSPRAIAARVAAQVHAQFADLPFGLGLFASSSSSSTQLYLPYDQVVAPTFLRQHATENQTRFDEDHFFATVHQVCEAWCCVMERQLDAAQADIDALDVLFDDADTPRRLARIARRYRLCAQIWEYMIDHCTMLTEMDMADYHAFRLQLHGASGGQSVRMRQLRRRIFHLLPLIPAAFEAYVAPTYSPTSFDPAEWLDLLQLLAHVRVSETPETNATLVRHLQQLYAHHGTPACHVMNVVQAVQTLENAVRRFYFGHQYMAIMVLGGSNTGSDGLTVKMLERTWKDPKRYLSCEQAKTQLSDVMDALHLQQEPDGKGKLMQTLLQVYKDRRAAMSKDGGMAGQCRAKKMTA
ncbi:Aste57867_23499 [Aphanomyces stellatus]|uniref:Aste57867_23499 protein n=1 Tax=Aphanomyces stellatus TaxID=120398 RepID=A0A485LNP0_9STRA|nr:hypothetical protein As57867_023428 [Aphanomyces stellatus]VFU00144.1 Aste57867_23499 [Aphanomyces stellatus]